MVLWAPWCTCVETPPPGASRTTRIHGRVAHLSEFGERDDNVPDVLSGQGDVKAANGEIIAASQGYDTKAGAEKGIESIKTNAASATVLDLTEEPAHK
jgi:uncharacterized protein